MDAKADGKALSDSYSASWKIIAEKVEQILNSEAKTLVTFEPLYSRVYRNVCNGFSEQMHIDLINLCSRHLYNVNQRLCSHDDNSVEHLLSVHQGLRAYLLSVKIISSIFSYLNKFYVACCLNADLCIQLSALFSQIVINERISTLMNIVEESLKIPFSIPPEILHNFFNELHEISNGEYSTKYLHLFSRYCPNVLPPMKESDLENHILEVYELKRKQKQCQNFLNERHGIKRPAEEQAPRKMSYCHRQPKAYVGKEEGHKPLSITLENCQSDLGDDLGTEEQNPQRFCRYKLGLKEPNYKCKSSQPSAIKVNLTGLLRPMLCECNVSMLMDSQAHVGHPRDSKRTISGYSKALNNKFMSFLATY